MRGDIDRVSGSEADHLLPRNNTISVHIVKDAKCSKVQEKIIKTLKVKNGKRNASFTKA